MFYFLKVDRGENSYREQRMYHKCTKTLPRYDELKQTLGIPLTELLFEYGIPDLSSRQVCI